MIHLRDYIINEEWQKDYNGQFYNEQEADEYLGPMHIFKSLGSSYNYMIFDIYERLGESIFRKKEFEKHPDIQFIQIIKNKETGYAPEAPSAFIYFGDKDTKIWIEHKCKSMNYYCSSIKHAQVKNSIYGELYVQINPNKPRECSQKILDESGGLIIHLTSKFGLDKILKEGIIPKSPIKEDRPEQIYFLSPTNKCIEYLEDFCIALTDNKREKNNEQRKSIKVENKKLIKWLTNTKYFDNVNYAVIFNIKDLKKHRKINFYEDTTTPKFPAYWTAEYIPANYIIGWQQIIYEK